MKKITAPLLFAAIAITIICSCKKQTGDIQNINAFSDISSRFTDPPAEFTTAPFFVWNEKISDEETDRFLNEFSSAGIKQVFIHPRPGLVTEYLSDDWFARFRHAVDKGKELGMKVWIYDENSYPSGFAGGHVPAEMPESYNQGQGLIMKRVDLLPDTLTNYYIILKEDNGIFSDITENANDEKGKTGKYILFSKSYYGKSDWYGGFSYVDLLLPGVTQKFIELTMTGYEKIAGEEFGKTIPGTFTDEPEIPSPGGIRFTPDLFEVFYKQWGYDLKVNLPSLAEDTGDWKRVRHNYTQTLLDLFIERWSKPWFEYCESKGLAFTGHYWEHEWPNMRNGGDNMAMYAWHQLPAIDMLFNQWDDSSSKAQFGNIRAVKELASAANQTGRLRKLSETYGGSGWDLTFAEMKRNGDWEYALGVNLMNQHLTYYTMAGARKYDYPPTFDYHQPWWDKYKLLNDHYTRLSLALSAGRQINDILILEPTTSCWLYDSYVKRNNRVAEIGQAFQSFITVMEKQQVEFDLGSERILKEMGSVKGKKLVVGNAEYSRLVIPPGMENINGKTFDLLKKFVANGGKLIMASEPSLVDGIENNKIKAFVEEYKDRIVEVEWPDNNLIENHLATEIKFNNVSGGTLFHHTRQLNDGKILFMVNSDMASGMTGEVQCNGASVSELNTQTGEISAYSEFSKEKSAISFSLPPAGSLLLFIHNSSPEVQPEPSDKTAPVTDTTIIASGIEVKRLDDNVLMIDFCDLTLGENTFRDLHVFTAADKVFKHHGFNNGNPWNTSVQYRRNIVDRDTFSTGSGYTATYRFHVKGNLPGVKLIVERPWQCEVSLNGKILEAVKGEWWLDRSFGVYNTEFLKSGDNEISVKMSPMKIMGEIEPVYLTGDFDVEAAAKGWIIKNPTSTKETGNWVSMGMPFYFNKVSYSFNYSIDSKTGQYMLMPGDWKGTVAEVIVNNSNPITVAFPPYSTDITNLLKEGPNRIEFVITGSLRNLLGPHHRNPKPGLVTPWHWRFVDKYPAGKEYNLYEYGLAKNIYVLNKR